MNLYLQTVNSLFDLIIHYVFMQINANEFHEEDLPRISEAQESARVSDGRESNRVSDGRESNRKSEAQESDRISEAQESNRISDARESNRLSEAQESNRISEARESNRISEARESNRISEARESNRISDAQASNTIAMERMTEPILVSSVGSTPDQMRASDTLLPVKGRRGSLNPQAEIIDPEHGDTQDVVRAQAEEAVIAAKLAEAERNFAEKAEKLVSNCMKLWSMIGSALCAMFTSQYHYHLQIYNLLNLSGG